MSTTDEVAYLVDDDPSVVEGLSELLASRGIECVAFGSACHYLAYRRADAACCLILDVELPDINGLEVQQQIAGENSPPIVFISGYGTIPDTVRAMKAGAVEFFTKPVDSELLIRSVREAFVQDREQRRVKAELERLQDRYSSLTSREREVLLLIAGGMLNKQAAGVLGINEGTVQVHRGQIMRKMEAGSFADLVRMAEKLSISSEA